MKDVTVQILVGLPGSGKTYYAESKKEEMLKSRKIVNIIDLDAKCRFLQGEWFIWDMDLLILDGLVLNNKSISNIIKETVKKKSRLSNLSSFEIIYWKEDRETCLNNDLGRREVDSRNTIQFADFEKPDASKIKELSGFDVTIIEKEIIRKPDYVRHILNQNITVKGDWMFSESWTVSGRSHSYDSEYNSSWHSISGEEPVEFKELYSFLEKYRPDLNIFQLRYIQNDLIEYEEVEERDYYSNCTRGFYKINLKKLKEYLSLENSENEKVPEVRFLCFDKSFRSVFIDDDGTLFKTDKVIDSEDYFKNPKNKIYSVSGNNVNGEIEDVLQSFIIINESMCGTSSTVKFNGYRFSDSFEDAINSLIE